MSSGATQLIVTKVEEEVKVRFSGKDGGPAYKVNHPDAKGIYVHAWTCKVIRGYINAWFHITCYLYCSVHQSTGTHIDRVTACYSPSIVTQDNILNSSC